jgi:hypothetical protein
VATTFRGRRNNEDDQQSRNDPPSNFMGTRPGYGMQSYWNAGWHEGPFVQAIDNKTAYCKSGDAVRVFRAYQP